MRYAKPRKAKEDKKEQIYLITSYYEEKDQ